MRKKIIGNQEFWMALGINLLFVIVYACLCHPAYEVSDDNAMAFFVEGAYGSRTAHLIFENIIWGKFLTMLSMLAPGIKWYTVCQYAGMFCAYTGISYFMMKAGGKMAGFAGSVFLLVFLGMESYVTFQWTRSAAIITIGGMLLLFYAVEYAEEKWEKRAALFLGLALCIVGSMIRFLFFAVCVVLSGGCILMKMAEIIKRRENGWKKRIRTYLFVYGSVGIASISLYGIDRACYLTDETWSYYSEYNSLRSELWDFGFPDYTQNQELYESLGISQSDIVMYRNRWNMDEDLLPIETLRALVDVKEKRNFSWEVVHEFVKAFFLSFLCKPLFGMILIVFIIFIALNRKNLLLTTYIFLGIMAFELYFYWTGRFGLSRIDAGMLAAGMTAVLCGRAEDLKRVTFQLRWMAVLACIPLLLSLPVFYAKISSGTTSLLEFTKMMSEDKENLYLLSLSKAYNPCTSGSDFWKPVPYGGFSNIYGMGGWEFNVPVKKAMLAKWGISNIYRDSIDALDVRLFSDEDAEIIEQYIRENYNENVSLCLLKDINSLKIWGVRSGGVKLEGNVNKDLSEIEHSLNWKIKKKISVSGYAYKKDSNSFRQQAYLKLWDLESGEITYKELTMSKLGDCTDIMNGQWSNITGDIRVEGEYNISVILEADGELYEIPSVVN